MDDVDRMVGQIIREKRKLLKGNIERFAQAPLNRCFSFKMPYFKGFLSTQKSLFYKKRHFFRGCS